MSLLCTPHSLTCVSFSQSLSLRKVSYYVWLSPWFLANYLRRGHKSRSAQQRFDTNPHGLVVLVLIEQDQLIKQHGPQCQELAAA